MNLNLGVHLGQQNLSMDQMRTAWRRFDAAGMDWISVWDHIYEAPPAGGTIDHFEAVSTLGALCADTSHARIGCLVFCVGYRNPALLAKMAATLDHISNGRFELGIGAGWHEQEATAYGYDFPPVGKRLDMLEEAAPLIRSLLDQERTTFDGEWFRTDNASNLPRPVQARLPVWIGGTGEKRTLPLAARYADGWNAAYVSAAEFGRLNGVLDEACEREGHDPLTIKRGINLQFILGADQAEADQQRQASIEQWGPQADRILDGALLGTPDTAAEQVAAYHAAGATDLNIALRAPWSVEALDAYFDDVVPVVRQQSN
ncbi:MAG: TIGR03560 family F420-dependent LLM class oxidoreductase [Actinomycetia bacterium]|nr:TIGR03560 family F420-dependent LLM class oxidoreductase [Actinomycetes bacterium]MCP3912064.1 TIGR03560 family F420-dependent LLM class oxidoreductase [Actinomycetes bacterium]MCP4086367.1 TIGR03560 family F420-dependent LLM class oxidoreductase [Actinomycetes bacterium]